MKAEYLKLSGFFSLMLIWIVLTTSCSQQNVPYKIVYKKKDEKRVEEILTSLESSKDKPVAELVVLTGKELLETPYVGFTVDKGSKEQLIVNLRGLDCTTFAENCLAISRTVKSSNPSFEQFTRELKKIRYRDGQMNGYPSRLHYFSEWIHNNEQKGLVKNVTNEISEITYPVEVDFMSQHPDSYRRIKKDKSLVGVIAEQETSVSKLKMQYIPEEKIREYEDQLQDGDIAGITTKIEGMDIQHAVILVRIEGRIHIMHASLKAGKVAISEGTLEDYLLGNQNATGIMIARPLD